MGTVYRRQVRFCTACDRRLDTTAARQACEAAGHAIEIREQSRWWIKYQVGGRPQCVSSHSEKKEDAKRLLQAREGDVVKGVPIPAHVGRVTFEDATADLVHDYTTNRRRSLRVVTLRLAKHLTPFFERRRLQLGAHAAHHVFGHYTLASLISFQANLHRDIEKYGLHLIAVVVAQFDPALPLVRSQVGGIHVIQGPARDQARF